MMQRLNADMDIPVNWFWIPKNSYKFSWKQKLTR